MANVVNAGNPKTIFEMQIGAFGLTQIGNSPNYSLILRAEAGGGDSSPIAIVFAEINEGRGVRPYWVHADNTDYSWGTQEVVEFPNAYVRVDNGSLMLGENIKEEKHCSLMQFASRHYITAWPIQVTGGKGYFLLSGRRLPRVDSRSLVAYEKWEVVQDRNSGNTETIFSISS